MPFEAGQSGNPAGRPKGATNKNSKELREMLTQFLFEKFEEIKECFDKLEPKDKVKTYCDLMSFVIPRLRPIDGSLTGSLSDEQLNTLYGWLQEAAVNEIQRVEAET